MKAKIGRPPQPKTWAWEKIEAALAHGPLRNAELAEEVYGERSPYAVAAVKQLLLKLVKRGYLVRVGWGWHALPDRRDEMHRVTRRHLLRRLREGPATVRELALALDVKPGTVASWLKLLREAGHPIRSEWAPVEKWTMRRGRWSGLRPYPVAVYWLEKQAQRRAA